MTMKVTRIIDVFDKKSEKLVKDININSVSLETLKEIFNPPEDDPLMYNPYWIHEKEAKELKKHIDIEFEFDKYVYDLGCFRAGT